MKKTIIALACVISACTIYAAAQPELPQRRAADPVLVPVAGGQLVCDPYDNAAGFQPYGDKIWALNWAARERLHTTRGAALFTAIPLAARANLDPEAIDSLRRRAESLC